MSTQIELDAIKTERQRVYGEPQLSHENIGLSWTGLIQQHYGIRLDHPLPTWLVTQMLVVFKVQRASRVYHKDNYDDAINYLYFAEDGQIAAKEKSPLETNTPVICPIIDTKDDIPF